ncbi:peroxidase [Steroidobacter denitrificans]|uniref:Peroxidase n=1 Tax=Steroidobacter denitrificans TaxID=465721 RepID=A0A127FE14_STEDE|nr:peroxidase [Steroidobacter denitrificans]
MLPANAQEHSAAKSEQAWLASLITKTPQEGFELATTLARRGVRATQPDTEVLRDLRSVYASDPDSLIAASSVVAIHFQTIAAANDYWRSSGTQARD